MLWSSRATALPQARQAPAPIGLNPLHHYDGPGYVDALFTRTGEKPGWDIYGDPNLPDHTCNNPVGLTVTYEYCPDHGAVADYDADLSEPDLGGTGVGIHRPVGGASPGRAAITDWRLTFMWHSHTGTGNDERRRAFPGGMMTMMMIDIRACDSVGSEWRWDGGGVHDRAGAMMGRAGSSIGSDSKMSGDWAEGLAGQERAADLSRFLLGKKENGNERCRVGRR